MPTLVYNIWLLCATGVTGGTVSLRVPSSALNHLCHTNCRNCRCRHTDTYSTRAISCSPVHRPVTERGSPPDATCVSPSLLLSPPPSHTPRDVSSVNLWRHKRGLAKNFLEAMWLVSCADDSQQTHIILLLLYTKLLTAPLLTQLNRLNGIYCCVVLQHFNSLLCNCSSWIYTS